ncbi:MAG: M15 family metallopeptidase [Fimbriimonas sp.]
MATAKRPRWDRTKGSPEPIAALNRIDERENGEPLVDIRLYCPRVFIQRPQVIPFVRERVAKMLDEASQSLPDGIRFGLIEGWRPLSRQQRIFDFMWRNAKEAFPEMSYASLRRVVCRLCAPTDQKAPPGHCTGAAVDVWLVDDSGEPLDTTSPYAWIDATPTYVFGLSETAAANRALLVDAMLAAGFSNCRDEWWHYSWGDAAWAVRTGVSSCPYGNAPLNFEHYIHLEDEHAAYMADRPNPFLSNLLAEE